MDTARNYPMAKSGRTRKNKQANTKTSKAMMPRQVVPRPRLDAYAAAYARLLMDPCGAPLVHPVYPGGDAGFLFRADSVASYGGASTETSGIVHWAPGYVNGNSTELIGGASTNASTAFTTAVLNGSPGRAFVINNASGVRCVAACMKVSYPGAESTRAGRLHYGHTMASTLDAAESATVDSMAPLLQNYSRMPADVVELFWRPGISDTEFNDPNANSQPVIRDRKSAMTVAWAGIPGSTGITIHFTAIYEWLPKVATGVSTNVSGKSPSSNTMDDVIDAINKVGFTWAQAAGHAAGVGLGMALTTGISRTFGLMPAARQFNGRNRVMFA